MGEHLGPTWSYRCTKCLGEPERCRRCRARRAAVVRARRARRRKAGLCYDCDRKPLRGKARCTLHNEQNNARSAASHARAREAA